MITMQQCSFYLSPILRLDNSLLLSQFRPWKFSLQIHSNPLGDVSPRHRAEFWHGCAIQGSLASEGKTEIRIQ